MVSFIILNFNCSELTLKCVRSIIRHIPRDYEIIVVDNNSSEEDKAQLSSKLESENCRIIYNKVNAGFGSGNQIGAVFAKGDYLCFINSDVVFTEDCITPLLSYIRQHPDTGCITPVQHKIDGSATRSFRHNPAIRHELLGFGLFEKLQPAKYPKRDGKVEHPIEVQEINGSFMLFPTPFFWKIGGFDTNIFLYYEEYDLAVRLRRLGLKCIVCPSATFKHIHDATTSKSKKQTLREMFISKVYVYRKYHNLLLSSIFQSIIIAQLLFKPHKWYLLPTVLRGETMSRSLRHRNFISR